MIKTLLKIVVFFPVFLIAQIPAGYYNSAQGLSGNNLKITLHNIIKNHTQVSYANLWNTYVKTDRKTNGKVWDIYSDVPNGTPPYQFTFSTDQCGSYAVEGDCYNREHSWPQSWFNSVTGPVSDMFHIYPTDGKVNGVRSNYPYGMVATPTWTSLNGSKLGPSATLGYSLTVFEPIDEYKGDIARGYFYMCVRYYSEDAGWTTSDATNKSNILPWELGVLLDWHHQDPVSSKEIARNDSIYKLYQHNRNPFIDNPQWADSIWQSFVTNYMQIEKITHSFSIFPNPSSHQFSVFAYQNATQLKSATVKVYDLAGSLIHQQDVMFDNEVNIDCEKWARGVYIVNISNGEYSSNLRFVKQ